MSRVNLDAAAAWLARETLVATASSAGSDLPGSFSFGLHLERAQKTAATPGEARPQAPAARTSPCAPESLSQEPPARSSNADSPSPSSKSGPPDTSTSAAESGAESSSSSVAEKAADEETEGPEPVGDRHDDDKETDRASEAAAVAGAATPAAQRRTDRAEDASSEEATAEPIRPSDSPQAKGKSAPRHAAAKPSAEPSGNEAVDANTAANQPAKPADTLQAPADGGADAAARIAQAADRATDAKAAANSGQASSAAVVPNQVVADAEEVPAAPATSGTEPGAAANRAETAVEAGPAFLTSPPVHAAEGQTAGIAARRAGARTNARASIESPSVQNEPSPPANAGVLPDVIAPPADPGIAQAGVVAIHPETKASVGRESADSPNAARPPDPMAARTVSAPGSEGAGPQEEEGTKTEAADRARFVQRVARAFESAADRSGHVRLRLHPPELGSLRLDLTIRDGHMSARLETETESARNMLLENLPALKERLAERQIKVESFDIEWRGQAQGGLSQQPGNRARWEPPSPGHVPRAGAGARGVAGTEAVGAPRRVGAGTSFDVVI